MLPPPNPSPVPALQEPGLTLLAWHLLGDWFNKRLHKAVLGQALGGGGECGSGARCGLGDGAATVVAFGV